MREPSDSRYSRARLSNVDHKPFRRSALGTAGTLQLSEDAFAGDLAATEDQKRLFVDCWHASTLRRVAVLSLGNVNETLFRSRQRFSYNFALSEADRRAGVTVSPSFELG